MFWWYRAEWQNMLPVQKTSQLLNMKVDFIAVYIYAVREITYPVSTLCPAEMVNLPYRKVILLDQGRKMFHVPF